MNNTVFKTPIEQPISTPIEQNSAPDSIVEAPAALRINDNPSLDEVRDSGEPYANTVLKTQTPFNYLPTDVQSDLKAIDKYVDEQIAEKGWKHNVRAYNEVMKELEFDLGLGEEGISQRIEHIAAYAKNMLLTTI